MLDFLSEELRVLAHEQGRFHYADLTYPADGVSLNAADMDNVVIEDLDSGKTLAEVDRPSSIVEVYEGAIYGHQGEPWIVERFDYPNRRAFVRRIDADWWTEADTETEVRILHIDESHGFVSDGEPRYAAHLAEVHVSTLARAYKKLKLYTRENIGIGEIDLPPEEFETEACTLVVDPAFARALGLEKGVDGGGLRGVAELIQGLVPLFVRVDPGDVRVSAQVFHPHFEAPTLTVHDAIPNGVGLSERIYRRHRDVLEAALGVISRCTCTTGCPACIGPSVDQGLSGKQQAESLLAGFLAAGADDGLPLASRLSVDQGALQADRGGAE